MKIQYLAVIFILIILPILIVLSQYTNIQIDTINKQTKYSKFLSDATYDTVKAFQLNTINNRYSNVASSKIRDVEAAANTFYKTLGSTLVYNREDLEQYVPALIFTLYDGYYVYTKSSNTKIIGGSNQTLLNQTVREEDDKCLLQPFIYYSKSYENGGKKAIINYTLDNYITVFYYNPFATGNNKYVTKSGYYIDPDNVNVIATGSLNNQIVTYNGVTIKEEELKEYLMIGGETKEFSYIKYDNKKIYYDGDKYFYYDNFGKAFINDTKVLKYAESRTKNGKLLSDSAIQYYKNSKEFSTWVN